MAMIHLNETILESGTIFEEGKVTVFAGGSSGEDSTYREVLQSKLEEANPSWTNYLSILNPNVADWNDKVQTIEEVALKAAQIKVFVVEKKSSSYTYVQLVEELQEAPGRIVFVSLIEDDAEQQKVKSIVRRKGGIVLNDLDQLAEFLLKTKGLLTTPYHVLNVEKKKEAGFTDSINFAVMFGGSCKPVNGYTWQDEAMAKISAPYIEGFNPVVADWNEECYKREVAAFASAELNAFGLNTNSELSFIEITELSYDNPHNLVAYIDDSKIDSEHTKKVLNKLANKLENRGVAVYRTMDEFMEYVHETANNHYRRKLFEAVATKSFEQVKTILIFIKEKGVQLTKKDISSLTQIKSLFSFETELTTA